MPRLDTDAASVQPDRLHRFHGGLRLRHNKQVSCDKPLVRPPLPELLVVPLLQHRGQPAAAMVRPGQAVLKGEPLGEAANDGARVHAPTSGTVVAIENRPMCHPTGQPGPCVLLRPDGEDNWGERAGLPNWESATSRELLDHLRQMGVVGLGGAVFPTHRKATSTEGRPIHTLILNGAECEPYIACDEMLMRDAPRSIVEGAAILRRAVGADRVIIAIEDVMEGIGRGLTDAVRACGADRVSIARVPARYPEGGERQLVQTLTGKEVPDGGLPQDLGLLVQNVATAAAVRDAILDGVPLIERIVTVTGNGIEEPRNFRALMGTPAAHLVAAAGGYTPTVARLVVGGPMMGYPLASDDEPVVKGTNCLLALDADDVRPTQQEMPCIRCGDCANVCPARLLPQELHFHARAKQWDTVAELGVRACIECGCCDHVCPSHIQLTQWFRFAKGELRDRESERAAADRARQRFDAREARIERTRQLKAERLARRKQKLRDDAEKKRQIADALERAGKGPSTGAISSKPPGKSGGGSDGDP